MSYADEYTEKELKRLIGSYSDFEDNQNRLSYSYKKYLEAQKQGVYDENLKGQIEGTLNFCDASSKDIEGTKYAKKYKSKLAKGWDYMTYHFNPLFAPVYLINICNDLLDMGKKALKLMIENLKPRHKAKDKASEKTHTNLQGIRESDRISRIQELGNEKTRTQNEIAKTPKDKKFGRTRFVARTQLDYDQDPRAKQKNNKPESTFENNQDKAQARANELHKKAEEQRRLDAYNQSVAKRAKENAKNESSFESAPSNGQAMSK